MNEEQSTISAFQSILPGFKFEKTMNLAEEFAQKRFRKKMEAPDLSKEQDLKDQAWSRWKSFDEGLPRTFGILPGNWYRARLTAHKALKQFRIGEITITDGSEFTSTRGLNSLESKLSRSSLDITRGAVDLFTDLSANHRGLKTMVRKRFLRRVIKRGHSLRQVETYLWTKMNRLYPNHPTSFVIREIWRAKVVLAANFVEGSRFSTVFKNNEKRRPINIEPLGNILVQRAIGNGIRTLLLEEFGIDLDNDADKHRRLVATKIATLDLRDASDSVTIALCKFLFPRWFVDILMQARSPLILGPDHMYHDVHKISSMGNGFTFELMTLIIACLGRVHDSNFSVFGDDIIVTNQAAPQVIKDLEAVGFVVNEEKSFIDSEFRESCGANFLEGYGYIESFDFKYPNTIHDCVTLFNKAQRLAVVYRSFGKLRDNLLRAIPLALRGARDLRMETEIARGPLDNELLSGWFKSGFPAKGSTVEVKPVSFESYLTEFMINNHIDFDERLKFFWSYEFKSELASDTLPHLKPRVHWAKYLMYLHGGRKVKDAVRDSGAWVRVLSFELDQSVNRWKDLVHAVDCANRPTAACAVGD